MRIISQDGTIDFPYEQVVIQRYEEKIYFLNKNLIGVEPVLNDIEIATYSTGAKAKKAMEMLHNEYQYILELFIRNGNGSSRPEFIFQFPADKDVRV